MQIPQVIVPVTPSFQLVRKLLDQLTWAVFIVSRDRQINFANRAAETLLQQGELVVAVDGCLSTRLPGQSVALRDALLRFMAGRQPAGFGCPLASLDGKRAAAYFLSLDLDDCCAVMIASSATQMAVFPDSVSALFDLTPAEARVSSMIAKGKRPCDIAQTLKLSVTTVRTHLSRAFAKTGAPDQAGLASLIHQMSPPIFAQG